MIFPEYIYTVEIKKQAFRIKEKILSQLTAQIIFTDKNTKSSNTLEYAVLTPKIISNLKVLSLENFYIGDDVFSILQDKLKVESNFKISFFAKSCFWDIQKSDLDFSEIRFLNSSLDFSGSIFSANNINFDNTVFDADVIDFTDCYFLSELLDFSNTKFLCNELTFNNTYFSRGEKRFRTIDFGKGITEFKNVDFNSGDVDFTGSVFGEKGTSFKISRFGTGKVNFSRATFGVGETSFEKVEFSDGEVSFRSAVFNNGKVNFISADFGEGRKTFLRTSFGDGNVYFKNAKFSDGKVQFRLATFGKGFADFHFCVFGKGDLLFDSADFHDGGLDFRAVNFGEGLVRFKNTSLGNGDIIFENSELNGEFIMKDTVLGKGEFNFNDAVFSNACLRIQNVDFGTGKVTFQKGKFKELSLKNSQLDNYFDLQFKSCKLLDLSNTVVKDILDIDPHIGSVNLSGMRLLGRIYLDWRRSNLKELILKQDTSYSIKAEQFRTLKENYNVTGQYNYEDQAYVEFKRAESRGILEEDLKQSIVLKVIGYLKYGFKWLIFEKMGRYATDPLRVLVTMLITYLMFTFFYIILAEFGNIHIISSLFPPEDPRVLSNVQKAFYHSAITFLTIGYGDYYPEGISRWLSATEGFVGLFMMSYFTVAFVRKVLR
ncbi:MAG: potassium channel family protein [Bacteroidota bacterium]|nr:potassium channel family protein [Bacteroidota bacterium]